MRRAIIMATLLAAACRPDAGTPDYTGHVGLRDLTDAGDETLAGPKPYVIGSPRLSIGAFYEGGFSEQVAVNDADTHYYIFTIEGTGELTFSQETSGERVEGRVSDVITLTGTPWWGGGLIWDSARDLSRWSELALSLRSSDPSFDDVEVSVQYEQGGQLRTVTLTASAYGYTNDDAWHSLRIPLTDFPGLDRALMRSPLILGRAQGGATGERLYVDDVYLE